MSASREWPSPSLDGELRFDDQARTAAAEDFGHLVHRPPEGVLLPASEEDVAATVRWRPRQAAGSRSRGTGTRCSAAPRSATALSPTCGGCGPSTRSRTTGWWSTPGRPGARCWPPPCRGGSLRRWSPTTSTCRSAAPCCWPASPGSRWCRARCWLPRPAAGCSGWRSSRTAPGARRTTASCWPAWPTTGPLLQASTLPYPDYLDRLIRLPPSDDPVGARRLVTANRAVYERVRDAGGTLYPVSAFPMSRADWRNHFGKAFGLLSEAKDEHDPGRVLRPGYEVF